MDNVILQTKLYIPKPTGTFIERSGLVERMRMGMENKLTLLSAPAGFGKTMLLSAFAAHSPRPVAWLALDPSDEDPVRFLSYMVAALQTIQPRFSEGIKSSFQAGYPVGGFPVETVMGRLINEIAQAQQPLVLILDDIHAIQDPQIHAALMYMIDHLPPNLHLIVSGRSDPPWPLARLRARGEMTEFRAADLRFRSQEVAEFLAGKMNLPLQPAQMAVLERQTEGWPAGLQLAAIALRSHDPRLPPQEFINSFTGSHRFVVDYLTDEVLQRQPEAVQFFLLHTSLLNRMSAHLCSALLAHAQDGGSWTEAQCQQMLEHLERENLFLIPLDERRTWYRYHHLFGDLLRHRLQQKSPRLRAGLHSAASAWYVSQADLRKDAALVEEALQHALAAETTEAGSLTSAGASLTVAGILDRYGEIFWQRGEHSRLRQWIERLPEDALAGAVPLNIYYAWLLLTGGQSEKAGEALARAEQNIDLDSSGQPSIADLRGKLAAVQAFHATFTGNFQAIIPAARKALAHLSDGQSTWRSLASIALGDALSLTGDTSAGLIAYQEACASCSFDENPYLALNAGVKFAMALRQSGRLLQAETFIVQQLDHASRTGLEETAMAGLMLAVRGDILCEWAEVQEGLALAEQGVQLCEQGGHIGYLGWSYLALARIRTAANDLVGLEQIIQRFDSLQPNLPPWLVSPVEALRGVLWLAQSDDNRLDGWVQQRQFQPDDTRMLPRAFEYLTYARILLGTGLVSQAETILRRLRQATTAAGQVGPAISTLVLETLRCEHMGDRARAVDSLETALRYGQPGRFLQIFLQDAPALWPVLQSIDPTRLDPTYLQYLTAGFRKSLPAGSGAEHLLSPRELEVLRLMADGLPNRQIGERLHISLNTVLFHTKNIFSKLNSSSRTQAVARARDARIL